MTTKKIVGRFSGNFRGTNQGSNSAKGINAQNISLYDCVIYDAVYIDHYNIFELDSNNENSILPINLDNIKLYLRDNQNLYFTNIEKPIIIDIKIVDILDSTATYGKIEGIIYATLSTELNKKEDFVETTAQLLNQKNNSSTTELLNEHDCFKWSTLLWNILKFLLILLLLFILWCYWLGPCSKNFKDCDCDETPKKEQNDSVKIVKQTFSDSTKVKVDTLSSSTPINEGQFEVTLSWRNEDGTNYEDDLDLILETPTGERISFNNTKYQDIYLDKDANAKIDKVIPYPEEHIYIPYGKDISTIKGTYKVYVLYYNNRTNYDTANYLRYKIMIKNQAKISTFDGVFLSEDAYKLDGKDFGSLKNATKLITEIVL